MRQEAAALQLWVAHEAFERERHELDVAERIRHGSETSPLRRRVGQAVIAFGHRLAGEPREHESPARRRLAARPS